LKSSLCGVSMKITRVIWS